MSYSEIQARRDAAPITVSLSYSPPMYRLALDAVTEQKPQVLVFSGSRVEEIRSIFFNNGVTEYNSSDMEQLAQYDQMLSRIPTSSDPQVIIMDIEPRFFTPNYVSSYFGPIDMSATMDEDRTPISAVLGNWWAHWGVMYGYYQAGEFPLGEIIHPDPTRIGVNAVIGAGFRNDGSFYPGPDIYSLDLSLPKIANGNDAFEYGNTISPSALATLDQFLSDCQARHIYVVGIAPPYSPTVYAKLASMPEQYYYLLTLLQPTLGAEFKKYGFAFYNFSDPALSGVNEEDMMDGPHPTERGMLKTFVQLVKRDPVLQRYANAAYLAQQLDANDRQVDIVSGRSQH